MPLILPTVHEFHLFVEDEPQCRHCGCYIRTADWAGCKLPPWPEAKDATWRLS